MRIVGRDEGGMFEGRGRVNVFGKGIHFIVILYLEHF